MGWSGPTRLVRTWRVACLETGSFRLRVTVESLCVLLVMVGCLTIGILEGLLMKRSSDSLGSRLMRVWVADRMLVVELRQIL